eukprot:2923251-Pleurochrysis_carterae.AAC.1
MEKLAKLSRERGAEYHETSAKKQLVNDEKRAHASARGHHSTITPRAACDEWAYASIHLVIMQSVRSMLYACATSGTLGCV